LLTYFDAL
jgi:hypothetical protein